MMKTVNAGGKVVTYQILDVSLQLYLGSLGTTSGSHWSIPNVSFALAGALVCWFPSYLSPHFDELRLPVQ